MNRIKSLIKLTSLNSKSLSEKELNHAIAGAEATCYCGCYYAGCGGSSYNDNGTANQANGWSSGLPPSDGELSWIIVNP